MIVNVLSPVGIGYQHAVGFGGAYPLDVPIEGVLSPGEADGKWLLGEMGPRNFSRGMTQGIIVPKGCQPFHAKIVLYGTVYCYTCGWMR